MSPKGAEGARVSPLDALALSQRRLGELSLLILTLALIFGVIAVVPARWVASIEHTVVFLSLPFLAVVAALIILVRRGARRWSTMWVSVLSFLALPVIGGWITLAAGVGLYFMNSVVLAGILLVGGLAGPLVVATQPPIGRAMGRWWLVARCGVIISLVAVLLAYPLAAVGLEPSSPLREMSERIAAEPFTGGAGGAAVAVQQQQMVILGLFVAGGLSAALLMVAVAPTRSTVTGWIAVASTQCHAGLGFLPSVIYYLATAMQDSRPWDFGDIRMMDPWFWWLTRISEAQTGLAPLAVTCIAALWLVSAAALINAQLRGCGYFGRQGRSGPGTLVAEPTST